MPTESSAPAPQPVGGARRALALLVIGLGGSLVPLDTSVNVAFPPITDAFALAPQQIRWVAVCYVLTYTVLLLACGRLGDRIGHRRVFRAGLAVSVLAFTLCALAPTYPLLLAGRIIQGLAAALVLSCAPALTVALYPPSRRTEALAMFASSFALAGALAPVIGGLTIVAAGWSGVFWFRVPIAAIAWLLVAQLAEPATAGAPAAGQSGPSDRPGPAAPVEPAAAGAATTGTLRTLMREPRFVALNLISMMVNIAVFASWLIGPYYLTLIGRFSALSSGLWLAIAPIGTLLGAPLAAALAPRIGIRTVAWAGVALLAAGHALIAAWPMPASGVLIIAAWLVLGLGLGLFQTAYSDLVMARFGPGSRGVAGSLTMVTRALGIVLGAVVLSAAMNALLQAGSGGGVDGGIEGEAQRFLAAFGRLFGALALALALLAGAAAMLLPRAAGRSLR